MSESFLNFIGPQPSDTGKTSIWIVYARGGGQIGIIKWFGRWRCYSFFPLTDTVFERSCLRDLADFCEARTFEHRKNR